MLSDTIKLGYLSVFLSNNQMIIYEVLASGLETKDLTVLINYIATVQAMYVFWLQIKHR